MFIIKGSCIYTDTHRLIRVSYRINIFSISFPLFFNCIRSDEDVKTKTKNKHLTNESRFCLSEKCKICRFCHLCISLRFKQSIFCIQCKFWLLFVFRMKFHKHKLDPCWMYCSDGRFMNLDRIHFGLKMQLTITIPKKVRSFDKNISWRSAAATELRKKMSQKLNIHLFVE